MTTNLMLGHIRSTLGRARTSARHSLEQRLHPWRRRRAQAQLERLAPQRILVMCLGNICRSPYAAAYLANRLHRETGIVVHSAGFIRPGRPSPDNAVAVAAARGVDLLPHRSQVVTVEDARQSDLVLVMDIGHARRLKRDIRVPWERMIALGDLDPQPIQSRTVRDPEGCAVEVFEDVYDRIARCSDSLVTTLLVRR